MPSARDAHEHAIQERLREVVSRQMARELAGEFRLMAKSTTQHNASEMIVHHKIRLYPILYRAYMRTFSVFGARLLEKCGLDTTEYKAQSARVQDVAARNYANKWAKVKAEQIGEATWNKISKAITDAQSSDSDVEDAIRGTLDGNADARARSIARTETHGASQDAQFEVAQAIGLNTKRWVATNDNRTRETHVEADGQEQDMDKPFNVGEDELMYPGDPSGSPEETVQCRCVVVFE